MSEDKYLQFPLCMLAYPGCERDRMEAIISYSYTEAGRAYLCKLDDEHGEEKRLEIVHSLGTPENFSDASWVHSAVVLGMRITGCISNNIEGTSSRYQKARSFISDWERDNGNDPLVRVRKALAFEVRDKLGLSFREFSVLCAVYSCIGAKAYPIPVRRNVIQVRSSGYKNESILMKHKTKNSKAALLTEWQVRTTLEKLHALGFYARVQADRRTVYYSHRMTDLELREHLLKNRTYMAEFRAKQRAANTDLMAQLKAKREIIQKTTAIIGSGRKRISKKRQTPATKPPLDHPLTPPLNHRYNKNSLK